MISTEVEQYVSSSRSKGLADDVIRQELLTAGWSLNDIELALAPKTNQAGSFSKVQDGTELLKTNQPLYASVPRRIVSFLVDVLVVSLTVQGMLWITVLVFDFEIEATILNYINSVLVSFIDGISLNFFYNIFKQIFLFLLASLVINGIVYLIYRSLAESSRFQATIGKALTGLKVYDLLGNRISFWRAFGRNVASILSIVLFMVGYLFPFFTKKKQTLHDLVSGTVVQDVKHYSAGRLWIIFIAVVVINFILSPDRIDNSIKEEIRDSKEQRINETAKAEEKYGLVESADKIKIAEDLKKFISVVKPKNNDTIIQECLADFTSEYTLSNLKEENLREQFLLLLNMHALIFNSINPDTLMRGVVKGVWLNSEKDIVRLEYGGASFDVKKLNGVWVSGMIPITTSSCISNLSEKISEEETNARDAIKSALPALPPFEIPESLKNFNEDFASLTPKSPYYKVAKDFLSLSYFNKLKEPQVGYSKKYILKRELNASAEELQKNVFFSEISTDDIIRDKSGKGFTGVIEIEMYRTTVPDVHPKTTNTFFIREGLPVAFEEWYWGEKTSTGYQTQDFGSYMILLGDLANGGLCLSLNLMNGNEDPALERGDCKNKIGELRSLLDGILWNHLHFRPQ